MAQFFDLSKKIIRYPLIYIEDKRLIVILKQTKETDQRKYSFLS